MEALILLAYSSNPPNGYAGNPPGEQYCSSCHYGPGYAIHSTTRLVISGLPASYTPGTTYDITVTVYRSGSARFGFQATIQDENNLAQGYFTATGSNVNVDGAYVEHQSAPYATDSFSFQFSWTAPSSDAGPLYMYTVGNAANGDGSAYDSGDTVFYRVDTIAAPSTSIPESPRIAARITPSGIAIDGTARNLTLELYTSSGKRIPVFRGEVSGHRLFVLPRSGFVVLRYDGRQEVYRFVKIR